MILPPGTEKKVCGSSLASDHKDDNSEEEILGHWEKGTMGAFFLVPHQIWARDTCILRHQRLLLTLFSSLETQYSDNP